MPSTGLPPSATALTFAKVTNFSSLSLFSSSSGIGVSVVAGSLKKTRVVVGAVAIYAVLIGYFALYSRHHLVSGTPEEEFAAIQAAEQDLR